MKTPGEEAFGVECAWVPAPEEPAPGPLWLVALIVLLGLGAWQLLDGLCSYVLLAFFS